MVLEKYKRWPVAIIDDRSRIWKRSKVKGWFDWVQYDNRPNGGYSCLSKYLTHPDFIGAKKIMWKKDLQALPF